LIQFVLLLSFSFFSHALPWSSTPHPEYKNPVFYDGWMESSVLSKKTHYLVLVPPGLNPNKIKQVIFYFPGGNGKAINMAAELDPFVSDFVETLSHTVILAPDSLGSLNMRSNTPGQPVEDLTLETMNYILKELQVKRKPFLVGHSMGGAAAIHFAFMHGNKFRAISSISPALFNFSPFEITDSQLANWIELHSRKQDFQFFKNYIEGIKLSFVAPEYWESFDLYTRLSKEQLPYCFKVYVGAKDTFGFDYLVKEYINYAASIGKRVKYYMDPNREHAIGTAMSYAILDMLKCH